MGKYFLMVLLIMSGTLSGTASGPGDGAQSAGMGAATVAYKRLLHPYHNPASLAFRERASIGGNTAMRFLSRALQTHSFSGILPVQDGAFGALIQQFGYQPYKEQKAGLAYGRKLTQGLAAGLQFNYVNTFIRHYGNSDGLSVEAGLHTQLTDALSLGTYISNPYPLYFSEQDVPALPAAFSTGLHYRFPDRKASLMLEAEKISRWPLQVKAGAEWQALQRLALRTGLGLQPAYWSIGLGLPLRDQLHINLAATVHQYLGFSPVMSFYYVFK